MNNMNVMDPTGSSPVEMQTIIAQASKKPKMRSLINFIYGTPYRLLPFHYTIFRWKRKVAYIFLMCYNRVSSSVILVAHKNMELRKVFVVDQKDLRAKKMKSNNEIEEVKLVVKNAILDDKFRSFINALDNILANIIYIYKGDIKEDDIFFIATESSSLSAKVEKKGKSYTVTL